MTKLLRPGWTVPLLIAALIATWVSSGVLAEQRQTREQHAFVTVLDANDAPITNLSPDAFLVREDGIAREVLRVAPAAPPSHLVMLVDDSQVTDGLQVDLRLGLKTFFAELPPASPGPITRLSTFGDRPTVLVEFTTTPSAVVTAVDRVFPRAGAGSTFLQAIVDTARTLKTRQAVRPVIVAFVAEAGIEFSDDKHQQIEQTLQAVGASLWTVVLEDRRGQNMSEANRERSIVLGDVLRHSGGYNKTVLSRQGIELGFKTIAGAIKGQLDVTYGRTESLIPPNNVEVTLKQDRGRVLSSEWIRP
jgi:hypothetical protein